MRIITVLIFLCVSAFSWNNEAEAFSFNDPLVDAADLGNKNKVARLLQQGHKPDSKGDFGVTALMRASYRGYKDVVEILIESGAYVNAADIGGDTPLHLAARNGHADIVKILLYYDAYIDIPDKEQWTPLMRAVMAKQAEVAKVLVEKGADLGAVNEMEESVLLHASMAGVPEIMRSILKSDNFHKIPKEQRATAIDIAKKKRYGKVGKMMVSAFNYFDEQDAIKLAAPASKSDDSEVEYSDKIKLSAAGENNVAHTVGQINEPAEISIAAYPSQAELARPEEFYPETDKPDVVELRNSYVADVSASDRLSDMKAGYKTAGEKIPPTATNKGRGYVKRITIGTPPAGQLLAEVDSMPRRRSAGDNKILPSDGYKAKRSPFPSPIIRPYAKFAGGKFFSIQLGAFSDKEQAMYVWGRLKEKNADIFANFSPEILRSSPAAGGDIYRLRSGRFAVKKKADESCANLKNRNVECFVVNYDESQYAMEVGADGEKLASKDTKIQDNQRRYESFVPDTGSDRDGLPWVSEDSYQMRNSWDLPASSDLGRPSLPDHYPVAAGRELPSFFDPSKPISSPSDDKPVSPVLRGSYEEPQKMASRSDSAASNVMEDLPWKSQSLPGFPPVDDGLSPQPLLGMGGVTSNRYAGGGQNTTPYQPQQMQVLPQKQKTPEDYGKIKELIDQEVRNMARKRFFMQQGIKAPPVNRDYEGFYKDVGRQPVNNVSEAILVPDETYFAGAGASAGNSWLEVEGFANKSMANDYAIRMFKSDESLSHLRVMLIDKPTAYGVQAAIRVGPLGQGDAASLCGNVRSGGFGCSIIEGRNEMDGKRRMVNNVEPRDMTMKFWVNMGTFADAPEAEYYWAFLQEDNNDVLGRLKYDMKSGNEHDAFDGDAVQLRVGPFDLKNRADQLCNIMRYRNVACLVVQ